MKRIAETYARFVAYHPVTMLVIVLVLTTLAVIGSSLVGTKPSDQSDMLPDDLEVIKAFDIISDNFGGSDSVMIAVQLDPRIAGSDEIRDMRDPRAIEYLYLLTSLARQTDHVTGATSAGTLMVSMNEDRLPRSFSEVREIMDGRRIFDSYISYDYSIGIITITLDDQYDPDEMAKDIQDLIMHLPIPPGLKVDPAGEIISGPIMEAQIGPDMQKTSRIAIVGIMIVLLVLFMSLRYAVTPLVVIGLGITWAFGYFGFIGISISSMTSGAISMIMGIGIDFGIQTVTRFRHELKSMGPRAAMEVTLSNVLIPMATTTLAALVGFRAMSMGDLTVLAELGTIMSYGVAFCFLAAITVVPVIAVLGEQINMKIRAWRESR